MKRVCAWCQNPLDDFHNEDNHDSTPITHGMCGDCARSFMAHKSRQLSDFLDRFENPVFLVDSHGRMITANSSGLATVSKNRDEIDGQLGGNVFGCKYANLPEGCGQSTHCKSCTIRRTVTKTLETGEAFIQVSAYPDLHHLTKEQRIEFLISTEKTGQTVLLRIDSASEMVFDEERQCFQYTKTL